MSTKLNSKLLNSKLLNSKLLSSKLPWSNIRNQFRGQWVELVDFDWDWDKHRPTTAAVRHHAADRGSLRSLINQTGSIENSVVMYMGAVDTVVSRSEAATC